MRILSILTIYSYLSITLGNYFHFEELVYETNLVKLKELLTQINLFYKLNLNHFNELEKCSSKVKELESSVKNSMPSDLHQVVINAKNQLASYFRYSFNLNFFLL